MPLELMENLSSGRPTLVGYASCGAKSKTSMTGAVISARQHRHATACGCCDFSVDTGGRSGPPATP